MILLLKHYHMPSKTIQIILNQYIMSINLLLISINLQRETQLKLIILILLQKRLFLTPLL